MRGGELIREARKRGGLTQRELAELLSTTQGVITRWESGRRSPSFERVSDAVRACGFELSVRVLPRDDQHALLIEGTLALSPDERLERVTKSTAAIQELLKSARKKH